MLLYNLPMLNYRKVQERHKAAITNMEYIIMTRFDVCIDYFLSVCECMLSLALATLTLSLPAVSALQAITSSTSSVMVVVLASVLFVGVVVVYALMAYSVVSAAISRIHYLY